MATLLVGNKDGERGRGLTVLPISNINYKLQKRAFIRIRLTNKGSGASKFRIKYAEFTSWVRRREY
jgi:hypothetical protein